MAVRTFAVGSRTTVNTIAEGSVHFRPGAAVVKVLEFSIYGTGTAGSYGLGFAATQGVGTPTNAADPIPIDPLRQAALSLTTLTYLTTRATATSYIKRYNAPATAGAGVIWTFPDGGLLVPAVGLVLQNITVIGATDFNIVFTEE